MSHRLLTNINVISRTFTQDTQAAGQDGDLSVLCHRTRLDWISMQPSHLQRLTKEIAMHKSLLLIALLALTTGTAQAAPADDACAALMEARGHLVSMIGSNDKAAQDALNGKLQAASQKVDATIGAMAKNYNAGDEAKAAAFKPVWDSFKNTRESEIIPLVYAGKNADAKAIATGIQAERMGKMKAAMGCK